MSKRKDEFIQNIINYVERGDCGHEGLEYRFEDSDNILYFSRIAEEDRPKKVLGEMYVNLKDPKNNGMIEFEFLIPGKLREIERVPVIQFIEYVY